MRLKPLRRRVRRWCRCRPIARTTRRSRTTKQTPPQATGGTRPLAPVTIDVAALLEVAAWCRQHLIESSGESPCPPTSDASLPPAADDRLLPADDPGDRLGSAPERPTTADP